MSTESIWLKYMPEYVNLYYVDYNDSLDHHPELITKCIDNNSYVPLNEAVYDWWYNPEGLYLETIESQMLKDGFGDEFEESYDEIVDWIHDHDQSTPVEDLVRNTRKWNCFYKTGVELESLRNWTDESTKFSYQSVCQVRKALHLKNNSETNKKIREFIDDTYPYGGELRIYFRANLEDLIAGPKYDSESEDFKTIRFSGNCAVALVNYCDGAANFEFFDMDMELSFDRTQLHLSKSEKWNLEEVICDVVPEWCDGTKVEFKI
jgi:hypothetical protein